jgi:hypothetical protein
MYIFFYYLRKWEDFAKIEAMKKKIAKFASYLEQYPTITLFELEGIFGTRLLYVLIFVCSIPLLIFSNQWVALFFATVIILSDIWLFFDNKLWMPDFIKRITLSQDVVRKMAKFLQHSVAATPSPSWPRFYQGNILVIAASSFLVGFIQPAALSSFFMALSLTLASIASFFESARISLLSYAVFAFACLYL